MIATLQKWGNSLGLRIPKHLAEEARVGEGSEVDLTVRRGRLIVRPVGPRAYRLETLLKAITRKNLHGEADAGPPEGKERL